MKLGDIRTVKDIKVYYPFFKTKHGSIGDMRTEYGRLLSYLILCDVIVIPPREFIAGGNGKLNIESLSRGGLISELVSRGRIVTTSTRSDILDFTDLVEYYSPKLADSSVNSDLFIYSRSEDYQKAIYTDFLMEHISSVKYYDDSEKSSLTEFLSTRPDHPAVLNELDSLQGKIFPAALERLRLEAFNSYFRGGAEGNDAIVPPMSRNDVPPIYNPFYSLDALKVVSLKVKQSTGFDITRLGKSRYIALVEELKIFKIQYKEIADTYQEFYKKLLKVLGQDTLVRNFKADILYSSVVVAIALSTSTVLNPEILLGSYVTARFMYSYVSRVLRISDKFHQALLDLLKKIGLYEDYKTDIEKLLSSFDNAINKAIKCVTIQRISPQNNKNIS